jgi:tripartite-type tricarboxylate transporter receptor subunit TctC
MTARRLLRITTALLALWPAVAAAQGDDPYKGQSVTLIIGSGAGGGIDLYGRVVARHIGRHLPGQPNVIPQNMPAAGSIAAANHLFNIAPKDGTVIGLLSQGLILDELIGTPGLRFELAKFTWIGRVSSDIALLFTMSGSKVKTVGDAFTTEATIAGTGAGSSVTKSPMLMNAVVGTKFKVIIGYSGTGASYIAAERGEVDGVTTGWGGFRSARPNWISDKKINLIVQMGTVRHPDLPDVPSWIDVAKTEQDKKLLWLFGANAEIGKSLNAPPGLPPERAAMLRKAFAAMLKDPAFLAEIKKLKMDLDHAPSGRVQQILADTAAVPAELRERARVLYRAAGKK